MVSMDKSKLRPQFMLVVALVVSTGIASIMVLNYNIQKDHMMVEVEKQAKIAFEQIVLTRQWNSDYGGVYVEKKEGVESNPYLIEVGVDPDITDVDGRNYTLKNPALMTRELSSYAEEKGLYRFHITGLKLINPANAPDDFERAALEEFEKGELSTSQIMFEDGSPIFQYMAPLYVEEACLKCHGHLGFEVGDVRGGISVYLPMEDAYAALEKTRRNIFLSAMLMIVLAFAVLTLYIR
jgi:hypothetical protein